jgi:hypothetical protein
MTEVVTPQKALPPMSEELSSVWTGTGTSFEVTKLPGKLGLHKQEGEALNCKDQQLDRFQLRVLLKRIMSPKEQTADLARVLERFWERQGAKPTATFAEFASFLHEDPPVLT